MKKICFLIGNINYSGGTERVTSIIANELVNKNFNVSILSLSEGASPFFELDSSIQLDSLFSQKVSMKLNFFSCCLKIRKYVQIHKIDTLIVVDSISCVFTVPALFGLNIKHICWEHFNFNVNLGVKFRDIGRKWAAKYCDYIITLTNKDKDLWVQALKKVNARIIPIANPVPYENVESTPNLKFNTVLALGRLTYQKGFDLLIEAWAEVCKVNRDWKLKIVGSGEDEKQLKEQARQLNIFDRINFLNGTKNVEQYYQTSSFYCMSSRFEGLPMVLLEAQAFGLPIVSFDCETGPSDLIIHNENGYLVEKANINELAYYLLKAIELPNEQYEKMILNAKIQNSKFNIQNIIIKWVDIL